MAKQKKSGPLRRFVGDPLVSLGKGIIGAGEAVMGGANLATHGLAGRGWANMGYDPEAARQYLDTLYSPEQRAENAAVANARGVVGTTNAMLNNPSTFVHTGIEAVPVVAASIAGGGGAARLAPGLAAKVPQAVNLAGAGLAEGAYGAAQEAERIRQAGRSLEEADALNNLDAVVTRGATDTAIGAAGRVINAGRQGLGNALTGQSAVAAGAGDGILGGMQRAARRVTESPVYQGVKSEGGVENLMQRGMDEMRREEPQRPQAEPQVGGYMPAVRRKREEERKKRPTVA